MPGTFLNYPFNPELFDYNWKNAEDKTLTAMFDSGAVVRNAEIATLIANGSDLYTIPFYKVIGGTPENYDGNTNITVTDPEGSYQTGVVFGRAHGWKERDFVVDYNSGADPMRQITSQVAHYWQKVRQTIMLAELNALFGTASDTDFATHTLDISATGTATDANKFGATTAAEAAQKALGDAAADFGLILMHSAVATRLAGLQLLEYRKYTDIQGIERTLRIADLNGLTVVVDDQCPLANGVATSYLLGNGAIQYAAAPVKTPSEVMRDSLTGGGYDALVTRIRETIHPNGFEFVKPASGYTSSPTDAQLAAAANWVRKADAKNIAIARVICNV